MWEPVFQHLKFATLIKAEDLSRAGYLKVLFIVYSLIHQVFIVSGLSGAEATVVSLTKTMSSG